MHGLSIVQKTISWCDIGKVIHTSSVLFWYHPGFVNDHIYFVIGTINDWFHQCLPNTVCIHIMIIHVFMYMHIHLFIYSGIQVFTHSCIHVFTYSYTFFHSVPIL